MLTDRQSLWTEGNAASSRIACVPRFVCCSCSPARSGASGQCDTATTSSRGTCTNGGMLQTERQEPFLQDLLLDPLQWRDSRPDKKGFRRPDFSHKRSKRALWLDNGYRSAWVDSQLAVWDAQPIAVANATDQSRDGGVSVVGRLCEEGQLTAAVEALDKLVQGGSYIDSSVLYHVLKRCILDKDLVLGSRVHTLADKSGYESNAFLANHIICMYASHGRLGEAMQVFRKAVAPDKFMWASIIKAHSEHGQASQAVKLYRQMRESSVKPNTYVFVAALKACTTAVDLGSGKEVHADFLKSGSDPGDVFVGSCLVDMYAKCGSLDEARRVFDNLPTRDVVMWNCMTAAYAQHGLGQEALSLYASMQQEGITLASRATFLSLTQACASVGALHEGKQLHAQIQERGLEGDVFVGSSLVDMYAKCGSLEDARSVFDKMTVKNVVTWTAMIAGYAQHELGQEALSLYTMMQEEGLTPANSATFACLLKACANVGDLLQGKKLHSQIKEGGLEADLSVGLVDMYAKCGSLEDARTVFDRLPTKAVMTWTAMIAGYVHHGFSQEALTLYASMQQEGLSLGDQFTFSCLLKACAVVGALQKGKEIHAQIKERALELNVVVANCLVDMYARCGSLEDAQKLFYSLPTKDVVTWNALINGYGQCHDVQGAVQCFQEMQQEGVEPNETTFICLLVACSHEGLVEQGQQLFTTMVDRYGITPTAHHYNCMVDLLGRSGSLDKAENMLQTMPVASDAVGWTSLLTACKSHGDMERGRRCFNHVVQLEPQCASAYVLLANIYANAGRWSDVERLEGLRLSAGAKKKPGKACIEVRNKVHEFVVGEERGGMSSRLRNMNQRVKLDGGHVPHTELVLKAVSSSQKEDALCGHAEKLALAYGLLNTSDGTPLLVTKNLRMCNDCHSSTKIISRVEKRNIVVRDAHRVHRFVSGYCSCGDRH